MEGESSANTFSTVQGGGAHVLLLPFPAAQGDVNPMLKFGVRLAYHGLRPTLVTTRHLLSTLPPSTGPSGSPPSPTASTPAAKPRARTSESTRASLWRSAPRPWRASSGRRPRWGGRCALVFDPHLPWARRVAQAAGVPTAAFFSQPCEVDVIYGEVWTGRIGLSIVDESPLRGLLSVELGPEDMPSFVKEPESYPRLLEAVVGQ